jgi:SSS family transporter
MNTSLGGVDWLIFGVYVTIVLGLGLWFAIRQESNESYFVGSRNMTWWAVGTSIFATAFSSVSFVMLPREGAFADYHLFTAILFIPFVITPLLWYVFVPLFLRLNLISVYEYLEIRFNRAMRRLGTVLFAGYAIGWMGSMLYAVGLILQAVLGLTDVQFMWMLIGVGLFATAYTVLGGFEAVVWTDVLQAVTLGGGMLIVLVLAVGKVDGGLSTVIDLGRANEKFDMFNLDTGLNARSSFFAACAFGLFMYLPGYTTSQITVQRYVSMSSLANARKALLINAVVAVAINLVFIFVGTTLFAFYHQAGAPGFPELASQDQIMPYFLSAELPSIGLTGLLVAGLFGAAMSSIDSGINSMTAVVVYDWLPDRTVSVGFSRVMGGVFGVCITIAALLMPYLGEFVIEMITKIAGTFLGLLLGVYLLGMFVSRANASGALLGLVAGAAVLAIVWTQTPIAHWWYGGVTLGTTFVAGTLSSYLFAPPQRAQLEGLVTGRDA